MDKSYNLRVGVILDGKYGERAYENIKKRLNAFWITLKQFITKIKNEQKVRKENSKLN